MTPTTNQLKQWLNEATPGNWTTTPIPGYPHLNHIIDPHGNIVPERTNLAEGQANLNLMVNAKKMAQELINHRETK